MPKHDNLATRGVLGARYLGSSEHRGQPRTHTLNLATDFSLCNRFTVDTLADKFAGDEHAPPTCPKCLKKDPRFTDADLHED